MDKVKKMYDLMVERYTASPYTQHQAEVYRGIRALADECDTVAVMTARLQNEGYNSMPTVAVVLDKLSAYVQAAKDTHRDDLVTIYRQAYENIKANPDEVFQSGYYDDVKKAEIKYAKTLERLLACFNDFLHFELRGEIVPNVELRYNDWKNEGTSFAETLKNKAYRDHFACSDAFLQRFTDGYDTFISMARAGKRSTESPTLQSEFEQAWNELKHKKSEIKAHSRSEMNKYKAGAVVCVAPTSAEGDYEYLHEEFEN